MPKYTYKCKECEEIITVTHGMEEKLTDCRQCDTIDSLKKIPSSISVIHKDKEVGKVVESHIEEARLELQQEKERITKREYKND